MEKFNLFNDDLAGFCVNFHKVGETVSFLVPKVEEPVRGLGFEDEQPMNGRCCE